MLPTSAPWKLKIAWSSSPTAMMFGLSSFSLVKLNNNRNCAKFVSWNSSTMMNWNCSWRFARNSG